MEEVETYWIDQSGGFFQGLPFISLEKKGEGAHAGRRPPPEQC